MSESLLDELKRYVGFGPDDEEALRELRPVLEPSFRAIADEFYARLNLHDEARHVLRSPAQVERLKSTLADWMGEMLSGPWDAAYLARRARIGHMHVKIALPQRYMFGAMTLVRLHLGDLAARHHRRDPERSARATRALARILDIELAIMLETYSEAFVERVQSLERQEKNRLVERLVLSEARYDEIVEKGEALIVTTEPDGRIVLFNRRCEALTGIDRATAASRTFWEIFGTHAEGAPVETAIASAERGQRWVRWHFTTLPASQGKLLCAIGIDVTDERALAMRTARAERLAALGTMAAGLAHEIRNPLNAAQLQLTLLQRRLPRGDVASQPAASAAAEIRRLGALVEEFLQFARPQPLRTARADLRATAQSVTALMAPEAVAAGVELALVPGDPVPAIIDEERLKQVLLNLLRNGFEASGKGGQVRIEVRLENGAARLEVADDGPGFADGDPVFEPFFTTKEGGTGLGLAIVHRIVTDHGGRIDAGRRAGWTVFTITLPMG